MHGAIAWTFYAIVECCFSSILRWMITPGHEYVPVHWGFTALLFILYPVMGLSLGGLGGFLFRAGKGRIKFLERVQPEICFSAWALFTLVAAYVINFIVNHTGSPELTALPPLFISFLLFFALVIGIRSNTWFTRLRFLANPWTASIVLLGLPWINREVFNSFSLMVKASAALIYPLIIFLISFCLQKIALARRRGQTIASVSAAPGRSILFLSTAILVVLGISLFLKQEPLVVPPKFKPTTAPANRPNVLLIVMDTVRADHMSLYGYERDTTPNLRKFAGEASIYNRAIAAGDVTLSTHGSIFTGLHAREHGAHFTLPHFPRGRPLAENFETLAENLSKKGYATLGIAANVPFLSPYYGLNQGFLYYDNRVPVSFFGKVDSYYIRQSIRNVLTIFASSSELDKTFRSALDINEEVFTCLNKLKKKQNPWFLFINYMDAHDPYLPPAPFDTLYPGKLENFNLITYRKIGKEIIKLERKLTVQEYNHLLSQYDGAIIYMDFQIANLIEKLRELEFYNNTLIMITSDHGEVFGRRNLIYHGVSVYQDQVHIPLIIKYPNIKEPHTVDKVVSTVDLMPTIINVLGYEIPTNIPGKSLLKLKRRQQTAAFSESFPIDRLVSLHPKFKRTEVAAFFGNFKLIDSTAGKRELYDLSKDPNETKNLYSEDGGISKELETQLNHWLASTVPAGKESRLPARLNSATLERLKSLGYVK
jgi:arylsulfatase A-like enzyme